MWVGPGFALPASWDNHRDGASGIVNYAATVAVVPPPPTMVENCTMVVSASSNRTSNETTSTWSCTNVTVVTTAATTSAAVAVGLASIGWVPVPFLAHYTKYVTRVLVTDAVGFMAACESDGFTTDFTPPERGTITSLMGEPTAVPGVAAQTVSHLAHLRFDGFDEPESGLREYLVALGTDDNPTSLRAFQTVGLASEALVTALAIPDGHVRATVRAVNRARLATEATVTLVVDTTPPVCAGGIVPSSPGNGTFQYYDERSGALYTAATSGLVATWQCVDPMPESRDGAAAVPSASQRLASVRWAIGTMPGADDVLRWTAGNAAGEHTWPLESSLQSAAAPQAEYNASLQSGGRYWVALEVTDWVGWSTLTISPAVVVDHSPPVVTRRAVLVNTRTGRKVDKWGRNESIDWYASFADYESGVESIFVAVTSSTDVPALAEMDEQAAVPNAVIAQYALPTPLQHSAYVLHVCARDYLRQVTCSAPYLFTVDLTPPTCEPPSR